MYSFFTGRDFNNTEIVSEIPAGTTRLQQEIQIFDDEINEAREEFQVLLIVANNTVANSRCRIPENDRKLICKFICV